MRSLVVLVVMILLLVPSIVAVGTGSIQCGKGDSLTTLSLDGSGSVYNLVLASAATDSKSYTDCWVTFIDADSNKVAEIRDVNVAVTKGANTFTITVPSAITSATEKRLLNTFDVTLPADTTIAFDEHGAVVTIPHSQKATVTDVSGRGLTFTADDADGTFSVMPHPIYTVERDEAPKVGYSHNVQVPAVALTVSEPDVVISPSGVYDFVINGYMLELTQTTDKVSYADDQLKIVLNAQDTCATQLEKGGYVHVGIPSSTENSLDSLYTLGSSEVESCNTEIDLLNKDLRASVNYIHVISGHDNYEFPFIVYDTDNYDNFAEYPFLLNMADSLTFRTTGDVAEEKNVPDWTVDLALAGAEDSKPVPIRICGQDQFSYDAEGQDGVYFGEGTLFTATLSSADVVAGEGESAVQAVCTVEACAYNPEPVAAVENNQVVLWCGDSYPKFDIDAIGKMSRSGNFNFWSSDLFGTDETYWACSAGAGIAGGPTPTFPIKGDCFGSATVDMYIDANIPQVRFASADYGRYVPADSKLIAGSFYVGDEEYLVRSDTQEATLNTLASLTVEMDSGRMEDYSTEEVKKYKFSESAGASYELGFDRLEDGDLKYVDCNGCRGQGKGTFSGGHLNGCDPVEGKVLSGLAPRLKIYEPADTCGVPVQPQGESILANPATGAAVTAPPAEAAGDAVADAADVPSPEPAAEEVAQGCHPRAVTDASKRGWSCQCAISGYWDLAQGSTATLADLWTSAECTENSDCIRGRCTTAADLPYYCCSNTAGPDTARKGHTSFGFEKKTNKRTQMVVGTVAQGEPCTTENEYVCDPADRYGQLQCQSYREGPLIWTTLPACQAPSVCDSATCVDGVGGRGCDCGTKGVPAYAASRQLCHSSLEGEYTCFKDDLHAWVQCQTSAIGYIWTSVSGCNQETFCDSSSPCTLNGCECVGRLPSGECDTSADCLSLYGDSFPCVDNQCVLGAAECITERDCGRGFFCIGQFCTEESDADECNTPEDCEKIYVSGVTYECLLGTCEEVTGDQGDASSGQNT